MTEEMKYNALGTLKGNFLLNTAELRCLKNELKEKRILIDLIEERIVQNGINPQTLNALMRNRTHLLCRIGIIKRKLAHYYDCGKFNGKPETRVKL